MYKIIPFESKSSIPDGDGTFENPYNWNQVASGGTMTPEGLSLISSKPYNYVAVNLEEGKTYCFYATNNECDSYFMIYDNNGEIIEETDRGDNNAVYEVKCIFNCNRSDKYILCYTDFDNIEYDNDNICPYDSATIDPPPNLESFNKKNYKLSDGFNEITNRPFKYKNLKYILPIKYVSGFFYADTETKYSFSSFDEAAGTLFNNITYIVGRNLNLGNSEGTLISGYTDYFMEKIWGYIYIENPGTYTFSGKADDYGALKITINEDIYKNIITWDGIKDYMKVTFPKSGYYPFEYYHAEKNDGQIAEVYWTTPTNTTRTSIPSNVFFLKEEELKEMAPQYMPQDNPIFYASLSYKNDKSETNQPLNEYGNVVYETIDNNPCATFDGSSFIYSNSVKNTLIGISNKITYSAWFRVFDKTERQQSIISCTESSGFNVAINGDSYDGLSFYLYAGDSYLTGVACSIDKIKDNAWNFVAITYDGDVCNVYLNDEMVYSNNKSGAIKFSSNNNVKLTIGGEANTNTSLEQGFNGSIADVRVYNRALNEVEIKNIYDEFLQPRIVIQNIISINANLNKEMSYTLNAIATTGDAVFYEIVNSNNLPNGIVFENGTFSGMATTEEIKEFYVRCYTNNLEKTIKIIMQVKSSSLPVSGQLWGYSRGVILEDNTITATSYNVTTDNEGNFQFGYNYETEYSSYFDLNQTVMTGDSPRTFVLQANLNWYVQLIDGGNYDEGQLFSLGWGIDEYPFLFYNFGGDYDYEWIRLEMGSYVLAFVYDGTNFKAYKDGEFLGSLTIELNTGTYDNYRIGRYVSDDNYTCSDAWSSNFCAIYDKALTDEEIQTLTSFINNR